jgi:prolyl-tRNA editing enzyme YbaK/EbsC (Cys-tRNA(Pro) deacylase)
MKPATHPTALRIQRLLAEARIDSQVVEFEQPTRTSAEAATAIGCTVAEIAKSVVFRTKDTNQAVVVVASGDNRVSEDKVATLVGESLGRASADFVREATGFVIGGVAPLGHANPVRMVLDRDLLRFQAIWAAAGTPFSIFRLAPSDLPRLTGATWSDIRLAD